MTDISIPDIRDAVAAYFGMTPHALVGTNRTTIACLRRAVGYHLCCQLTEASHSVIGREFGKRDHSSVARGLERPLPVEYTTAVDGLREQLLDGVAHAPTFVRRFPFRSRRKPHPAPMFIRRHTA